MQQNFFIGNPKTNSNRFEAISNAAEQFSQKHDPVETWFLKVKEVEDWLTVESEEKLTSETTKEDPDSLFTGSLFNMV